jgi:hypothetical protein
MNRGGGLVNLSGFFLAEQVHHCLSKTKHIVLKLFQSEFIKILQMYERSIAPEASPLSDVQNYGTVILVLFQTMHNEDPLLVQGGQKSITYRSKSFHPRGLGTPPVGEIIWALFYPRWNQERLFERSRSFIRKSRCFNDRFFVKTSV